MTLECLEDKDLAQWDEAIKGFDSRYLFHQSVWLRFIEATQRGRILRLKIVDGGEVKGYFAGLLLRKGIWNILGSPLPGTTTNYMGPLINRGLDIRAFIKALEAFCREEGIHHLELINPVLDKGIMEEAGYAISEEITYVVQLSRDENAMWQNLRSECRNRIQKGKTNNLIVEDASDLSFADEYYDQLVEVFARQGLYPTYSRERVKGLFLTLKPGNLLALKVRSGDITIATGLFPYDEHCIYFFGGASWSKYRNLCPNELLHWTAMMLAAGKGIAEYDMSGEGSFKPKFGGKRVVIYRYMKSFSLLAKYGRAAYKTLFYVRQKLSGGIVRTHRKDA